VRRGAAAKTVARRGRSEESVRVGGMSEAGDSARPGARVVGVDDEVEVGPGRLDE